MSRLGMHFSEMKDISGRWKKDITLVLNLPTLKLLSFTGMAKLVKQTVSSCRTMFFVAYTNISVKEFKGRLAMSQVYTSKEPTSWKEAHMVCLGEWKLIFDWNGATRNLSLSTKRWWKMSKSVIIFLYFCNFLLFTRVFAHNSLRVLMRRLSSVSLK